jgi:hypothetical protein
MNVLELAATITDLMSIHVLPSQRMSDDPYAHTKKNVYTYNKPMVVPVILQLQINILLVPLHQ